ncbi:hypothetical protein CPB86DRAFT_827395, partial [Serendipita vermifera]
MQVDENVYQVVGFVRLNGVDLYDAIGREYETPLISNGTSPDFILRTKIVATENIEKATLGTNQQLGQMMGEARIEELFSDGVSSFQDFKSHGNLQNLERAISKFEAAAGMVKEGCPEVSHIMSNLGVCLRHRFEELGSMEDINNSIKRLEVAATITADNNIDKL